MTKDEHAKMAHTALQNITNRTTQAIDRAITHNAGRGHSEITVRLKSFIPRKYHDDRFENITYMVQDHYRDLGYQAHLAKDTLTISW